MIDCRLKQIHRVNHTLPTLIDMHTHSYDELTYYIYGEGTTQCGEKVYPYKNKTFAFYRAGNRHNEDNHKNCKIIYLHFRFDIGKLRLREGVFEDSQGTLLRLLQELQNVSLERSKFHEEMIESKLANVLLTAASLQESSQMPRQKTNWQQILNFIEENNNTPIDFKKLAESHNYSYDRFRHVFLQKFGISPYAYLQRCRIESAKMLLKNSNFSITDIAYDCGFNSSSQFTNCFKTHTGLLPSQYRKEK